MKKLKFLILMTICFVLLTGCSSSGLSKDFDREEVEETTKEVINILINKDTQALLEISTVEMKEAMTEELIDQIYESIEEAGSFEEIEDISIAGQEDKDTGEEFAVAVAKAKFENKSIVYTISFNKQMKLAGLYYK